MISTAFSGAGQTCWQTPHPVHASSLTVGFPFSVLIASSTGQCSLHTLQKLPWCARQVSSVIRAVPMTGGSRLVNTPGSHALTHGVSSHIMHGCCAGLIMGVPAASRNCLGACVIASCGHAWMHALQRVH
jgi:hypothetical protein